MRFKKLLIFVVLFMLGSLAHSQNNSLEYDNEVYNPILFEAGTTELSNQGEKDFEHLLNLLETYENITIEVYGITDQSTSVDLATRRLKTIVDSLKYEAIFSDRITIGSLAKSLNAGVGFRIISEDYFPCTGGSIVNFSKTTNEIIETRCDSLVFLCRYIKVQTDDFVIIGIYNDLDNKEAKSKAKKRAKQVRKELIALGIKPNKLKTSISYFKKPTGDEPRDWPFYPDSYEYEIGVYINLAI